jgi:hypothetical protein
MNSEELRKRLLVEADYKDRLADDLERAGAWQADLMRAKVKEIRGANELRKGPKDRRARTDKGRLSDAPERTKRIT